MSNPNDLNGSRSGLIRTRTPAVLRPDRRAVLGGAAAALGAGFLGLGGRAFAQSQTTVTFLGWQGYDEGLRVGSFLKDNGIQLNTTYIGNNDEIVARLAAGGIGQIDIVTPYMGYIPLLALRDLIEPIDESLVPNLKDVVEPFRSDPNLVIDGTRYGVPFTWGSGPMLYDPSELSEPPAGWADLLDESLQGRVGMMDDPLGNITLAALTVTDAATPTELTQDQLDAAIDFLIKMKRQSRIYAASWGELADALARSEIVATFSGWETIKKFAADKGKEVLIHYPKEGTFAWLDNFCIARDAPNRELAHKMANQIIAPDPQVSIGDEMLQGIVSGPAIERLEVSRSLYSYDNLDSFTQKASFFPFPPLEPEGDQVGWPAWQEAYQRFRSA